MDVVHKKEQSCVFCVVYLITYSSKFMAAKCCQQNDSFYTVGIVMATDESTRIGGLFCPNVFCITHSCRVEAHCKWQVVVLSKVMLLIARASISYNCAQLFVLPLPSVLFGTLRHKNRDVSRTMKNFNRYCVCCNIFLFSG